MSKTSTKRDLFTSTPTLKPDGLRTKWGGKIVKIHGVGSGPQERPLEDTWWVRMDVYYEDEDTMSEGVEYHPCQIFWNTDDHPDASDNMDALCKAVMYHLNKHGKWSKQGVWSQFEDAVI